MRRKKPTGRGRPLKRKTPLRQATPLKRVTPLKPGEARLKRTELRAGKRAAVPLLEREKALAWRLATLSRACDERGRYVCPVCRRMRSQRRMEAHHVVEKQKIRHYVAHLRLPKKEALALLSELLWDARNGLPVCEGCHAAHTSRLRPISISLLDEGHWEFARSIGLDHLVEKTYAAAA